MSSERPEQFLPAEQDPPGTDSIIPGSLTEADGAPTTVGGVRVLGIDPGSVITGYALVSSVPGRPDAVLHEAGVVRLGRIERLVDRLVTLHEDMSELINQTRPDLIAIEKIYAHYAHPTTAIRMAHARGVILLAARQRRVDLVEVAATEVKKAVTGHGHATKRQIQLAVQAQCRLLELPTPSDVADAIAIALTVARRAECRVQIEERGRPVAPRRTRAGAT